jgi:eukaryotic-like serine/threonine-protein kinase
VIPLNVTLAGRYLLEHEIGRGGMATVYRARDLRHDRHVAVKVMSPDIAARLGVERFLAEIKVTANLQHPNILPLFDSGEVDGQPFYVMPFVDGESLRARLDRDRQLPVDEALRIAEAVAAALDYAHRHSVVHRDLKPENILLQEGQPLVADFGIALAVSKAGGTRLTETGLAIGTPAYMSPEQAAGDPTLDGRSDLYSLACVLYEMLTGEPPYTAQTAQAMIVRRLVDPMPSIRAVRDTVPVFVEETIRRALAKAPADRFATMGAFADALRAPAAASAATPPSVAVLPFTNMSADPENEYFADGITEDVIAQLAKIRSLRVISRTSVMPFKAHTQSLKEIASVLRVGSLLEGSVRRAGNRVRIVAQLIDAATDHHLWASTYDRQLTDIFAIQTEVALQIAAALEAELSPAERTRLEREPTTNLHAYQVYLRGRDCFIKYTDESLHRAVDYFKEAIALDPRFALAYAGMAKAFVELSETGVMSPAEALSEASTAAAKAIDIDAELGEAHCAVAYARFVHDFDWSGAEDEFKRALELSPGSADAHDLYGRLCASLGRYDESIALQLRAQELDPLAHRSDIATALLRAGRNEQAAESARSAIASSPEYARAHATLGWALFRSGNIDEGLAALERAVALSPGDTLWFGQLGQAAALAGRLDRAREILATLEELSTHRYVSPYHLAYVYTGLGQHDRAMDLLETAFEQRAGAIYGVRGSFLFEPLRSDPRFHALLRRMNLA